MPMLSTLGITGKLGKTYSFRLPMTVDSDLHHCWACPGRNIRTSHCRTQRRQRRSPSMLCHLQSSIINILGHFSCCRQRSFRKVMLSVVCWPWPLCNTLSRWRPFPMLLDKVPGLLEEPVLHPANRPLRVTMIIVKSSLNKALYLEGEKVRR